MQKPDVLLSANYSPWSGYSGGIQKSVDQLAVAMDGLGARVAVLYSKAPWEALSIPERPYPVHWAHFFALRPGISSPGRFFNAISFARVARKIAGPRTLVHGNGDEAWLYPRFFPGRFVYTHRQPLFPKYVDGDWHSRWHRSKVFWREKREWAYGRSVLSADRVACTSQFSAEHLVQLFPLGQAPQVIFNGIDPVFLSEPMPQQDGGILFFGRLSRGKGVLELVEAWRQLSEELRLRFPLRLVGGGELESTLKAQFHGVPLSSAPQLAGVLRGRTLAREIGRARVVVLPSLGESFGNAMVEAIAMGQKIVTTPLGAIPEIAGVHADYLANNDAKSIYTLLLSRLHSWKEGDALALRMQRRRYVQERFSWEKSAKDYFRLYETVML